MGKKEDIRKHYEGMDSEQIAARLISGEVSDDAIAIGSQILTERGIDPETAMSAAAKTSTETAPVISDDASEITGKSGKVCPFCHSTEIRGYWTTSCQKCGATYSYSIWERVILVFGLLATIKGFRTGNYMGVGVGIALLIALGLVYYSRGTFYGKWHRKP